jgi:hypothetical protein
MTIWIACVDLIGARLFYFRGFDEGVKFHSEIRDPELKTFSVRAAISR